MTDPIPSPAHRPQGPHLGRSATLLGDAVRDEPFLRAFLPYALALAARHGEPVGLLCVATDRLAAIRELLGPGLADSAAQRVAAAVASALRASDMVARLDDGRAVAVLSFAAPDDLPTIAEAVRAAVALAGRPSCAMPRLTASVGLAAYPDHAHDAESLLAAGLAALDRARRLGPDRLACSERRGRELAPR